MIAAYFDPAVEARSNGQRRIAFHDFANAFNLGGGFTTPWNDGHYSIKMSPVNGIDNLIKAIAHLQQFYPCKGIASYFDSGKKARIDYVIN